MSKHTPGPWVWTPESESIHGYSPEGEALVVVYELNTNEADARLIAAAPDHHAVALELDRLMLVIESAVRRQDPSHSEAVVAMLKANRAAIAKATGETNEQ